MTLELSHHYKSTNLVYEVLLIFLGTAYHILCQLSSVDTHWFCPYDLEHFSNFEFLAGFDFKC